MNENLTLSTFAEPITGLADTPALSAAELKRRFQAPAEELRQAHNALAEAHAALDEKVEGIIAETYGGTIHENMLDVPLSTKINAKAEQSDMTAMQTSLAHKCELYCGAYTGDGADSQMISLGFTPKAVLAFEGGYQLNYANESYGGLAVSGNPAAYINTQNRIYKLIEIVDNGFIAYNSSSTYRANKNAARYHYIAFQ